MEPRRSGTRRAALAAPAALAGIVCLIGLILSASALGLVGPGQGAASPSALPATFGAVQPRTTMPPSAAAVTDCGAFVDTATGADLPSISAKLGAGILCLAAGRYAGPFEIAVDGQTWRLATGTVLAGAIRITGKGVTIEGGRVELPTTDRWREGVTIAADDVTVEKVSFQGGGLVVSVDGHERVRILGNDFAGQTGSAISLWGKDGGSNDALIEGNHIVQTATSKASPITSRGNESSAHDGVQNARAIIRNNVIDQGPGDIGWFGIELKQSRAARIEGNTIKGGRVLVSLPESDDAVIVNNTFDMRGTAYWGVEVANANDVVIEHNTFIGNGPTAGYAVALNSGSLRTAVRYNQVSDLHGLFAVSGDGHMVTDNCLSNVATEYDYRSSGGPNITFARNGPC